MCQISACPRNFRPVGTMHGCSVAVPLLESVATVIGMNASTFRLTFLHKYINMCLCEPLLNSPTRCLNTLKRVLR